MSNVLIFCTRWIHENDAYPQNIIFKDKKECCIHPSSNSVYEQAIVQYYMLSDRSDTIVDMFGINYDKEGVNLLVSVAKELLISNFGDAELLSEDIESADWGDLLQDIYDTIESNKNDAQLINVINPFIPRVLKMGDRFLPKVPLCFEKREDDYLAIGISVLPYMTAGDQFGDAWSRALLSDFSHENDNVILALHGSTDWDHPNETGYGHMVKYSEALSSKMDRNVHVYVYKHVDFDHIAEAIRMGDSSLQKIWTHIINSYGKE